MALIPAIEEIQVGEEATIGDGAAATIQLAGKTLRIFPRVDAQRIVSKSGTTMPSYQSVVGRRWSEFEISGMPDYTTMRLWLDSMFTVDAVSPHTYLAVLAGQTPKSHCLYYGQTGGIYKIAGAIGNQLDISSDGQAVSFTYRGFGQPTADGASLGAIAEPSPPFIMPHHCDLYLDPIASAAGSTVLTDLGKTFSASLQNNRTPAWHLGNQAPDSHTQGKWDGSLALSIEADTAMLSYLGDILDATVSALGLAARIRMTNATQIFDLDFAGEVLEPPDLIPEEDGITVVNFTMTPKYSSQAAFLSCWKSSLTLP